MRLRSLSVLAWLLAACSSAAPATTTAPTASPAPRSETAPGATPVPVAAGAPASEPVCAAVAQVLAAVPDHFRSLATGENAGGEMAWGPSTVQIVGAAAEVKRTSADGGEWVATWEQDWEAEQFARLRSLLIECAPFAFASWEKNTDDETSVNWATTREDEDVSIFLFTSSPITSITISVD